MSVRPPTVLALCVANSARSQMTEALLRHRFGDRLRAWSAGSEPSRVNPYAERALARAGVSSEGLHSKHVDTIDAPSVDLVVTLCAEEACPLFLGDAERWDWAMPDPDRKHEDLTDGERLHHFEVARDAIAAKLDAVEAWLEARNDG